MGCLKNIFRAIIITLAAVGFMSLGGREFVEGLITKYLHPSYESMLERAQKVGDFSGINDEFEIEKAAGIMGYNAVIAEHKASGQKMLVVDSGAREIITGEDITAENAEERLKNAIGKVKYQAVSVDDLKITKRGEITSFGKTAPYIKFEAKVKKLPINDVSGIISVVKNKDGEPRLLISANEKSKYSQLISDEFFKEVK